MRQLRFSLARLMGVVLFAGVGFAALRFYSLLWASALFTLTVGLLTAGIVAAMALRGRARMMWAGLAVFGWVYLGMSFGFWPRNNSVSPPPLLTQLLFDYFGPDPSQPGTMVIDAELSGETYPEPSIAFGPSGSVPMRIINLKQYRRVGHSLGAILFGLLGAILGSALASRPDAAGIRRDGE
jgi:hypothetical protein